MAEFESNERFDVLRRLGTGACGVVYEVVDRERQTRVALKTLSRLDAAALYRFKREFRALADVSHPNLVQLYELFAESRGWFFTMELVPGGDFLSFVRNTAGNIAALDTISDGHLSTLDGRALPNAQPTLVRTGDGAQPVADAPRLRTALGSLARGVAALHEAGMLHRDLKPSNVLVTEQGRVVIVDYGLATELGEDGLLRTEADGLVGTPAYMAPEQGNGASIGPSADWYAVGVMLYEALAGRLPFLGAPLQVLSDKMRFEPPAPRELRKGVPEDLDRLCVDLLRRKPESRPTAAEVLRRLGIVEGAATAVRTLQTHQTVSGTFVGREHALDRLRAAFERAREGKCVRVWVKGPPGMGKTALVRRFLENIAIAHRPIVLSARCYERESVPYKAFDGVVDELSRYLRQLPRGEADALMPRDAAVLARVFPVLARVPSVADAPRRTVVTDVHQMRTRAFAALRDLLARIADRRPLVIFIDDLQWGDADSAALLAQLTAAPDPPSMLVIGTFRSEDESGEIVRAFLQESGTPQRQDVEEINVDALTPDESRRLAGMLLGTDEGDSIGQHIAEEAGGNALFVGELVRYVQSNATRASSAGIRLERVLRDRVQDLSEAPQKLLEVLAIASRPLGPELARQAAGLEADEGMQALTELRLAHFVRTSGANERRVAELNHDRVREAVLALLTENEQRELHARLADVLRAQGDADPEVLFTHFRAAGRDERAVEYAELAAAKAERAFAFDRAAYFYRFALQLRGENDENARRLRASLGGALAHAGRGAEAAEAFLAAAITANEAEKLELQRRAAEQLLASGHVDRGVEAIETVLSALGMRLAATPTRALVMLVFLRMWLTIRLALARKLQLRDETATPANMLTRIDVCWSIGAGFAAVDTIRAAQFQTRNAHYCLDAREPRRLARALALESILQATQGPAKQPHVRKIIDRVAAIHAETGSPVASAYLNFAEAGLAYFTGSWRAAADRIERDTQRFLESVAEGRWEQTTFDYFGLCAYIFAGDFAAALRKLPSFLREAEERGDLYLHTNLRVGDTNLLWLVNDDPEGAMRVVDESMGRWSRRSFHLQHYYELQARANVDLYRGDARSALERVATKFRALRSSMQLRIFVTRLKIHLTRGRAAIRLAREGDASYLSLAEDSAQTLLRDPCDAARASATLLRAGILSARGQRDAAVTMLREAVTALDGAHMTAHAAAAERALGAALGGDEGAELVQRGSTRLRDAGVRDVERFSAFYVAF